MISSEMENETEVELNEAMDTSQYIEISMYLICLFVGGPLNAVSLFRLLRTPNSHKHGPSSIVILRMHLNIADLFTLFVYVPKQVIWLFTFQWYGGDILCRLCAFFNTFCFYLHSFVIVCIAIDRVVGAYNISSVSSHRRAYARVQVLLAVAWTLAILLSLPQMLIFRLEEPIPNFKTPIAWQRTGATGILKFFRQCVAVWQMVKHEGTLVLNNRSVTYEQKLSYQDMMLRVDLYEKVYSGVHLLFVFVVPILVIIACYMTVIFILKGLIKESEPNPRGSLLVYVSRKRSLASDEESRVIQTIVSENDTLHEEESTVTVAISKNGGSNGESTNHQVYPKKKRTTYTGFAAGTIHRARQEAKRQAALIILAYVVCWTPYNVMAILNATFTDIMSTSTSQYIAFLNGLITANPIVNPIIYGVLKKI